MRLTQQELAAAGIDVKRWLGAIQRTAREENKTFALNGPVSYTVRRRSTRSVTSVASGTHAFMGGEKFRIGGVVADRNVSDDSMTVKVTLVPADLELAGQISGMTMLLDQAFEHFEGFEEWAGSFDSFKQSIAPIKPKPKPIEEQRAANATWGTW